MNFTAPHIEYVDLLPIFILLAGAVLGVLAEAFAPREVRYLIQVGLSLIATVTALVIAVIQVATMAGDDALGKIVAEGAFALDGPTLVAWVIVLTLTLLGVLLFAERRLECLQGESEINLNFF